MTYVYNPVRLSKVEVVLVRKYFELIFYRKLGPELTKHFYAHLFEAQPTLRNVFPHDMVQQNKKLAKSIQLLVEVLPDLSLMDDHFVRLSRAHRNLGLGQGDFRLFAVCLIRALEELSGEKMIGEARNALTRVCLEVGRRITEGFKPRGKKAA